MTNTLPTSPAVPPTIERIETVTSTDYRVHLSDERSILIYAQYTTWGEVWYQSGTQNYLQVKDGARTRHGNTWLIEFVLDTKRAARPTVEVAPEKPQAERAIIGGPDRCFYKVARLAGLNTANVEAMKKAMREFLGWAFKSRSALKPCHWRKCRAAVEAGLLTWA